MGEIAEVLHAFKGAAMEEKDGEAQYNIMIESAKRNERKLEPQIGDKIIGTMFIMVRAYSGRPLRETMMNMYPVNVQEKMADHMKEQERIEDWDSWLKEAVLKGEADI
ncbi:hypothetical protein FRC01_006631 [Tulasnella sp. 417]|nr:hypothetical protein FRC01_006631 [Tulasnella sp. 417]